MMNVETLAKKMTDLVSESQDKGTKPYDTTAEVVRIDGDIAWCHFAGGIDETPVQMTISAKVGDKVHVRVSGGTAWITGNGSAPPTDDATATQAMDKAGTAEGIAVTANEVAEKARINANRAIKIAGDTDQHFWHVQTGEDTGTHITEIPKGEFLEDPNNGGGNTLIRSNGIALRDGMHEIVDFTRGGIFINNIDDVEIVSFSKTGETMQFWNTQFLDRTQQNENLNNETLTISKSAVKGKAIRVQMSGLYVDFSVGATYDNNQNNNYGVDNEALYWWTFICGEAGQAEILFMGMHCGFVLYDGEYTLKAVFDYSGVTQGKMFVHSVVESDTVQFTNGERDRTADIGHFSGVVGLLNAASGLCSFAMGRDSKATGDYSFAQGLGTSAESSNQFVIGQHNTVDTAGEYAFIIGNGTGDSRLSRRNALTVSNEGEATILPTSNATRRASLVIQHSHNNKEVFVGCIRKDKNIEVDLGVGAGGINHGVWSETQNRWLLYGDNNNNVYVAGLNLKDAATARSSIGVGTIGTKNSLAASDIPSLDAAKITSGTFAAERIPNLNASKITAGTLGGARLPVMFKTQAFTSDKFTQAAGAGKSQAVTITVPSGYEFVGVVGFNCSHNQAGSVGAAYKSAATTATVVTTNRTSSQWTDMTVTAYALFALANIY